LARRSRDVVVGPGLGLGLVEVGLRVLHEELVNKVFGQIVRDWGRLARRQRGLGTLKNFEGGPRSGVGGGEKGDGNGAPPSRDHAQGAKVPGRAESSDFRGVVLDAAVAHVVGPALSVDVDCDGCRVDSAAAEGGVAENVGGALETLLGLGEVSVSLCEACLKPPAAEEGLAGALAIELADVAGFLGG